MQSNIPENLKQKNYFPLNVLQKVVTLTSHLLDFVCKGLKIM